MHKIIQRFKNLFSTRPILTNAVVYGTLYVGAECSQQILERKILTNEKKDLDRETLKRYVIFGTCIQGPILTFWYRWLDSRFVGKAPNIIVKKVLIDQFVLTPHLVWLFFVAMSIMEGKKDVFEECKQKYISTFQKSCMFWLPAQSNSTKNRSVTFLVLALVVEIFIIYTILVILIGFGTYYCIVYALARFKYGLNFIGFIDGIDVKSVSKNITTLLLIVEDKHNKNNVFETVKNAIESKMMPNKLPKFQATFTTFMGYQCIIKKNINLHDCIKKLPVTKEKELDENELMKLLSECYSLPLPNDGTVLWDVFIGVQRLKSHQSSCYPVFIRVHQGIDTPIALLETFTEVLADREVIETLSSEHPWEFSKKKYFPISINDTIRFCFDGAKSMFNAFCTLILAPSSIFEGLDYKGEEFNFINKPNLSGEEVFGFKVEERSDYLDKVNQIKTKVTGTTYTDVMIATFSGSLKNYLQKHSPLYPEYLTTALHVLSGNNDNRKVSVIYINLPIFIESEEKDLVRHRLDLVKSQTDFTHKSMDMQINRFIKGLASSVIPLFGLKSIFGGLPCSCTLCVVSGPQQFTIGKGSLVVTNYVFWLPQHNNCSVNVSVLMYNNRLHVGINGDKSYIRSLEAAQEIINGIFTNLDQLQNEVSST
ncbi:hypothetical protein FQR65_LT07353 [Abscondita terminalis]|nr:hypothetical protein FQR65_LT07353 [Abscondita terminalis]